MGRNPWRVALIIGVAFGSISFFFWGLVTFDVLMMAKLSVAVFVAVTLLIRLTLR